MKGLSLFLLASVAVVICLILATKTWINSYRSRELESYWRSYDYAFNLFNFTAPTRVPDFTSGTEPALIDYLALHPLMTHLASLHGAQRIWEREGDHLRPLKPSSQAILVARWVSAAQASGQLSWIPTADLDPQGDEIATLLMTGKDWIQIQRIRPGSQELECYLRLSFGSVSSARICLVSPRIANAAPMAKAAWGAEPNRQIDLPRAQESPYAFSIWNSSFNPNWLIRIIPGGSEIAVMNRGVRIRQAVCGGGIILISTSLFLGLWMRQRHFRRRQLESDRLAALTHSLKTPLTIHKFRCDAIRLKLMPPDLIDGELIRLSEEVDHFTRIIEQGLMYTHPGTYQSVLEKVEPAWLGALADDLIPTFEREQRELQVTLCPDNGMAALSPLRAGLLTLLENALIHGSGLVTLATNRQGNRFEIQVRNQGTGLEAHELRALGKPLLRLRALGQEGFSHNGNGLGLSLLVQMAENEGWGLTFASVPGSGLACTLVIHAES